MFANFVQPAVFLFEVKMVNTCSTFKISKYKKSEVYNSTNHYENMPIQIYKRFQLQKLKNFQIKPPIFFYASAQNIDCGYSLEPPRRGGSNEYQQSMLFSKIRKIMYTPVNPSFTI